MNNWNDQAHLFANGKFKLWHGDKDGNYSIYDDWGVDSGETVVFHDSGRSYPMDSQLKLISRPISHMTDKEVIDSVLFDCLKDKVEPEHIRRELQEINKACRITARMQNYLLSIGVYPFDQSHFEDGTVIDATEV